jgi:hypothetical protein
MLVVYELLGCAGADEAPTDNSEGMGGITPTPSLPPDDNAGQQPPSTIPEVAMSEIGVAPTGIPPSTEVPSDEVIVAPALTPRLLEFHLLFVHGVQNCADDRRDAQQSLDELQIAIDEELPGRIANYEAEHPGVQLDATSAHANLYTATPSGFQPSDSADPLNMDDWEIGDPGCSAAQQGEPCTTAFEWRYRLVQEIERNFGPDAQNIVLIGHSTGARAAFEVTANVGSAGLESYDWGVQARILGVASVHGMVDALGSDDYDLTGPTSFEATCKFGDLATGFGSSCAHGNGWCEYAAQSSARDAADWVAQNKQALLLTSFASCSPSLFTGATDGPLPVLAQASPLSTGLRLVPSPGKTLAVANGEDYGSFCHSAITSPSVDGHAAAVAAARARLLDWLFVKTRRVRETGSVQLDALEFEQTSPAFSTDSRCSAGQPGSELDVVGICQHSGFFDGDDHAVSEDEWLPGDDVSCPSALRWSQSHDADGAHAARVFWKTYEDAGGVLGSIDVP